ncbi:MAG: nicotinate (nicotinamide) nucleotide adenylyltransferase [Chloroflexota bacterium]|nr:nicotinate (nicotinamide) nucleotide adenylyltransferase [Chloroflexota bacterium]
MNARTRDAAAGGIGILGGSFDPIHRGHLAIAADVAEAYALARVLFVPARRSPLRGAPAVAAEERLRMCELATAYNPRFEVSGLELERPPPSYTRDTIAEVRNRYPERELTIIVGADLAEELEEWRAIEELLNEVRMVVVERPGAGPRATWRRWRRDWAWMPASYKSDGGPDRRSLRRISGRGSRRGGPTPTWCTRQWAVTSRL